MEEVLYFVINRGCNRKPKISTIDYEDNEFIFDVDVWRVINIDSDDDDDGEDSDNDGDNVSESCGNEGSNGENNENNGFYDAGNEDDDDDDNGDYIAFLWLNVYITDIFYDNEFFWKRDALRD